MKYLLLTIVLFGLIPGAPPITVAQERTSIQLEAGAALSYVSKSNTIAEFRPRIFPNAGINIMVPVAKMGIRTGFLYQQKGWEDFTVYRDDSTNTHWDFTTRMNLHALTIPLQLYYCSKRPGRLNYFVAAGISYSFVLSGKHEESVDMFQNGTLTQHQDTSRKPYIGVIAKDSALKATYNNTMYYRFVPSIRIDAGLVWQQRYSVRLFWERSINSISVSNNSAAALTLGYCGISLGVDLSSLMKRKPVSGS